MCLDSNFKIIEILKEKAAQYPDLRFCQLLWKLEIIRTDNDGQIIDNFYEPSNLTLERIKRK